MSNESYQPIEIRQPDSNYQVITITLKLQLLKLFESVRAHFIDRQNFSQTSSRVAAFS